MSATALSSHEQQNQHQDLGEVALPPEDQAGESVLLGDHGAGAAGEGEKDGDEERGEERGEEREEEVFPRQYVERVVGSLVYFRSVGDFSLPVAPEDITRIFDFHNVKFADHSAHIQDGQPGSSHSSSSRTVAAFLRSLLQQSGKLPPHIHLKFKDQFVRQVNSLLSPTAESALPSRKKSKKGFTELDFYKIAFCHDGCPTKLYIGGLFRDYVPGHPFPLQVIVKGACIHQASVGLNDAETGRTPRPRGRRKIARRNLQQKMIGVVGSEDCEERLYEIAVQVGALLAKSGCCVVTDGRSGVMEAASKGGKEAGGHTLAVLSSDNRHHANPYVEYAIATGMGTASQTILCNSCAAIIAIGGDLHTLAEVSLALFKDKPLACIDSWAFDTRMRQASTAEEAVEYVLSQLK